MCAAVQPELKQPLVQVNAERFMWQRSSADDRGLAHGPKEELGMGVGYYKTADVKGMEQRFKMEGIRHERVMARWKSS